MARARYQVLIMPFRHTDDGQIEYACLRRSDIEVWQGIAGGGENGEVAAEAALREAVEEAGVPWDATLYRLETTCSIPTCYFEAAREWPADLLVIPEYAFAIDCTGLAMRVSAEHSQLRWGTYEQAWALLGWDSNKTALWELRERLRRGSLGPPCDSR